MFMCDPSEPIPYGQYDQKETDAGKRLDFDRPRHFGEYSFYPRGAAAIDSLCGINILLCCVEQKPSGILGQCTVQSTQEHRLWTGDDASVRVDLNLLDYRLLHTIAWHFEKTVLSMPPAVLRSPFLAVKTDCGAADLVFRGRTSPDANKNPNRRANHQ